MEQIDRLNTAYDALRAAGKIHTQQDLATLIGVNRSSISRAMSGDPKYMTESFIRKVEAAVNASEEVKETAAQHTVPVIPTGARAGTLADWAVSYKDYDCERMVSPIRGADYAITVSGDSMSPDYPSGSHILVKKVDEAAFISWGEVYLLDTVNGPVLKRVRKTDQAGVVECASINPAYQPFRVECRNIFGWYRVLMCLALK